MQRDLPDLSAEGPVGGLFIFTPFFVFCPRETETRMEILRSGAVRRRRGSSLVLAQHVSVPPSSDALWRLIAPTAKRGDAAVSQDIAMAVESVWATGKTGACVEILAPGGQCESQVVPFQIQVERASGEHESLRRVSQVVGTQHDERCGHPCNTSGYTASVNPLSVQVQASQVDESVARAAVRCDGWGGAGTVGAAHIRSKIGSKGTTMRIRTVKPSFWTHRMHREISSDSALVALALLNYVDDDGIFEADTELFSAACFPLRRQIDISVAWGELCRCGWLVFFVFNEGSGSVLIPFTDSSKHKLIYGLIPGFRSHQVINRPTPSLFPPPPKDVTRRVHGAFSDESCGKGKEGKGFENGIGKEGTNACDYSSDFLSFWDLYPRKAAKGDAWKAWQMMAAPKPTMGQLESAIDEAKDSKQWQAEDGRYIPMPSTWLRQRRWEDDDEAWKPAPVGQGRQFVPNCGPGI